MSADERLELAPRLVELLETASLHSAQSALLGRLIEEAPELHPALAAASDELGWPVAPHARRALDASVKEARRANRRLLDALAEVGSSFDRAGLRWTVVKGMEHLLRFHEPLGARTMEDVDLLVTDSDFLSAVELLADLGFEAMAPEASSRMPGHAFRRGIVMIDLHRSLTVAGMPPVFDAAVWDRRQSAEHEGLRVALLPIEASLLASALLAAREGYRAPGFRLRKGLDLLRLVEATTGEQTERASTLATRTGVRGPLLRALAWSAWLRGGVRPAWLATAADRPKSAIRRRGRELLRHAALFDSPTRRLQVVAAELATTLVRVTTGRRLGRTLPMASPQRDATTPPGSPSAGDAFRRAPDTLHRRIDAREVVLEPRRGRYFALDGIGVEVWALLDRPRTLDALVAALAPAYDVTRECLRTDLDGYLRTLEREGLLERCDPC